MEWTDFGEYKVEKQVKDEVHMIKIMHKDYKEYGVFIVTMCIMPKKTERQIDYTEFNNLGEFTELNRQDAINLYYILNRSSMYMDNIV